MNQAAGQPHDDPEAADERPPPENGRKAGRAGVTAALRRLSGPLREPLVRHQAKIRRWAGISGLALGVGLMAGGLEPIGFSLILLGTAVLLVDFDQPR